VIRSPAAPIAQGTAFFLPFALGDLVTSISKPKRQRRDGRRTEVSFDPYPNEILSPIDYEVRSLGIPLTLGPPQFTQFTRTLFVC